MSGLTIRIITCDRDSDCDSEYGGDAEIDSLDTLRYLAGKAGWVIEPGGRDLCPRHATVDLTA